MCCGYIAELGESSAAIRTSNLSGFGHTAKAIDRAVADLLESTRFLQNALAEGQVEQALAGATPYLRQFALTAGAAYLAKAALGGDAGQRIALCRFYATICSAKPRHFREAVIGGGESLIEAGASLVA